MAVTFLESGGDATFNVTTNTAGGLWGRISTSPSIATDFVHGSHLKSIKYNPGNFDIVYSTPSAISDSGTRISLYTYFNVLPSSSTNIVGVLTLFYGSIFFLRITTGGVLQLVNNASTQIGSNGATLSTGNWYRICISYTITSTTVFNIKVFVNGVSSITASSGTLGNTASSRFSIGNYTNDANLDFRSSDHYVDNSSSLTDTGDIWVTAKRPNANGTTNGFTTQIGSGGSGYGTGHSPQVNERALSTTNGWSMVGAGSAITEEYSIESASTGDIDISTATIVDYVGWVDAKSLASETASIIVGGISSNISLTSTTTIFTQAKGSTTYPSGNTDIGIITTTALTTVSLYECGIMVAYIPSSPSTTNSNFLAFM